MKVLESNGNVEVQSIKELSEVEERALPPFLVCLRTSPTEETSCSEKSCAQRENKQAGDDRNCRSERVELFV